MCAAIRGAVSWILATLMIAALTACAGAPVHEIPNPPRAQPPPVQPVLDRAVVAVALGGGAARGFAHVGALKAIDDLGVQVDIVTGTSAGSVVGALYAGGIRGAALVDAAHELERENVTDFVASGLGVIGGEKLQQYVNRMLQDRPIEMLETRFAAVATDLHLGRRVSFTWGDTGMAVRASSSVPGVFRPVRIEGRMYVDGGLVSQVPVATARDLGADVVIAVDVSKLPDPKAELDDALDVVRQSFLIMSQVVVNKDLEAADVHVRPDVAALSAVNFEGKQAAIDAGERAVWANATQIRDLIAAQTAAKRRQAPHAPEEAGT